MDVNSIGTAQRFAGIPKGGAFLFDRDGGTYPGIKVESGTERGAVVIAPHPQLAPETPWYRDGRQFSGSLFSMPNLRCVPSPYTADVSTAVIRYDCGKMYLCGPDQQFLLFKYITTQTPIGRDMLLNLSTGDATDYSMFQEPPVAISRWALVAVLFEKPITVFTDPSNSDPLVF
jgi:hypothetical protein